MKKKEDEHLRKNGYVPVEEYVEKNIETQMVKENLNDIGVVNLLKAIRVYDEASQIFHQPGGDGHYIVQRCLQKYLDCKFIQKNRRFRFIDSEQTPSQIGEREYQYVSRKKAEPPMIGTQADIYYLLFEAGQESTAAKRCKDYVHSGKLPLTAVLISLIEQAIHLMDESEIEKRRECGKLLRAVYMTPSYAGMETAEIYTMLGYTKKQYYTMRNQGISLLSEYLFGFFAGEKGLADLYFDGHEIVIRDLNRWDKKEE